MSVQRIPSILFLLLVSLQCGLSQFSGGTTTRGIASDSSFLNQSDWITIDSVNLYYTHLNAPLELKKGPRDTLNEQFRQYDIARRSLIHKQHLGNTGSPARSQFFSGYEQKGIHSGFHQYDLYMETPETFKFYNTNIPLTEVYASQGAAQENGMITAKFGRNFAKGVKLSFLYSRVNQIGQYLQQRNKNTNFGTGVHVDSENGRYTGYYGYLSNSFVQEHNGGITSYDSLLSPLKEIRFSVPVQLDGALSTLRNREFFSTHYYHVIQPGDSTRSAAPLLDIKYGIRYSSYFHKYADETIGSSSAYYDGFITDDRGLRNFIGYNKLINEVGFTFFVNPKNRLGGSLEHRFVKLNQEPITDQRNELFINGHLNTILLKRFALEANGYFGLLDASANFNLQGKASLDLDKIGRLSAFLRIHQRRPDLIEESLYINQIAVWERDFKNVNTNVLEVAYSWPKLSLETAFRWWILDNFIYYGEDRFPNQFDNSISLRQFYAKASYRLWKVDLGATIGLQNYNATELALPDWIIEAHAAINGRVFKRKLSYQLGVDLRMTNSYSGVGYFPLSGQFHLDSSRPIAQYPALDAFLALKIKTLKFFFKSENITSNWTNETYDQVIGYPQFEAFFRFGFSFQFYN